MSSLIKYLMSSAALLFITSNAFALVEAEVAAGSRAQKVTYDTATESGKTKVASGSEIVASVLFDPIPAVPVSFGLTVQSTSINTGKVYEDYLTDETSGAESITFESSAKGTSKSTLYGPMVKVWVPMPIIKPYLKFAYLTGSGTNTMDWDLHTADAQYGATMKGSQKFSHSGTDIDLGVGFSPVKFFTCFLELGIHKGKSKVTSQNVDATQTSAGEVTSSTLTSDDLTDDEKKSTNSDATSIRFGLGFGF